MRALRAARGCAATLASRCDAHLQRSALAATAGHGASPAAAPFAAGEMLSTQAALARAPATSVGGICSPLAPPRRGFAAAAEQPPRPDSEGSSGGPAGEKPAEGESSSASSSGGFASSFKGANAAGLLGRARAALSQAAVTVADAVKAEVRLAMMDEAEAAAERKLERAAAAGPRGPVDTSTTSIATVKEKPKGAFGRRLDALRATAMPILDNMRNAGIVKKVGEMREDLKDRLETSDSPLVHKLQDLRDGLRMEETPRAAAERLIREREPDFDIHELVLLVKGQVPKVVTAYLKGDLEALRRLPVSKAMMERFQGIVAQLRAEGNEMDSQVLDVSDVEVVEVKVHEGLPLVVVQFQVQQINCVRDRSGRIVEGAADDIQSVYYVWAVEQQFEPETFTAKWMLCEMAVRGMHAIV